ncbi:MAG: hypothetical protein ACLRSY_02940 [Acutalibacter sp.]
MTCPSCGDTIQLNDEMLKSGSIVCPGCGETLEFDFDDDEEEPKPPPRSKIPQQQKPSHAGGLFCVLS